jgi:hypothetical protein
VIDRRTIIIAALVAAGAALGAMFVIVAAGWSPNVGYVLALAVTGAVLVLAVRRVLVGVAAPAWTRPTLPSAPVAGSDPRVATVEMTLRRGTEDAGICRRRVQPMLFDLATHRLRRLHGVELIEDPERAQQLLGDEPFRFLTEVVTGPIPTTDLERVVTAIEAL